MAQHQQKSILSPIDEPSRPGARKALILLLTINLFNYIDRQVLAAVEPRIREHFFPGAAEEAALGKTGLLATAFLVSYMVTAPLFGWLADRFSRWTIIAISVILWSLASGASGLAATFGMLLVTRCFVGIGEAGYGPAAPTLISDFYPVSIRGAVLSWFYMAIPVGAALGYALGGFVAGHWGWRWAFYVVTVPGLLLGAICFLMRDPRGPKAPRRKRAKLDDYLQLFRIPSYVLDCGGMTLLTFAIGGISYFMPAYLVWRQAGDLAHVNIIFGATLVVGGLSATLLGGWTGDKLRPRFAGSYFLVSAIGIWLAMPPILLMLVTPFPAAWVFVFLAVFFLFFNTGPSNTILANVTPSAVRATAFAVNILVIHALGDAISPPLLGRIVGPFRVNGQSIYRWNSAFVLVAATMIGAGALWIAGARYLARDTARASAAS